MSMTLILFILLVAIYSTITLAFALSLPLDTIAKSNIRNHHRSKCSNCRGWSCLATESPLEPGDCCIDSNTTSTVVLFPGVVEDSNDSDKKERRVRYKGKYPRNFNERYKELDGDDRTIQKVLAKGMTPAGQHVPILLNECLYHLGLLPPELDNSSPSNTTTTDPSSNGRTRTTAGGPRFYIDCTLGYGGHSMQILKILLHDNNPIQDYSEKDQNRLICFDRDPIEIVKATERLNKLIHRASVPTEVLSSNDTINRNIPLVTTVNRNFRELRSYLTEECSGVCGNVTAILADLGLSSMQIDDAARGFTYKREGPLDMRMEANINCSSGEASTGAVTETARELLSRLSVKTLTKMLQENSDEQHAEVIAKAILGNPKKGHKINDTVIPSTTMQLATVVRDAVRPMISSPTTKARSTANNNENSVSQRLRDSPKARSELDSTVARVMQAIRIAVNQEFEAIEELLNDLPYILAPGGRVVVLTFHSGEDRRVKKSFKEGFKSGIYSSWSRDVVRPSVKERRANPRSSSCKLRWAIRSDKACCGGQ